MYLYRGSIQLHAQERFMNNFAKSNSDLNKSGVPSSMRNMPKIPYYVITYMKTHNIQHIECT